MAASWHGAGGPFVGAPRKSVEGIALISNPAADAEDFVSDDRHLDVEFTVRLAVIGDTDHGAAGGFVSRDAQMEIDHAGWSREPKPLRTDTHMDRGASDDAGAELLGLIKIEPFYSKIPGLRGTESSRVRRGVQTDLLSPHRRPKGIAGFGNGIFESALRESALIRATEGNSYRCRQAGNCFHFLITHGPRHIAAFRAAAPTEPPRKYAE